MDISNLDTRPSERCKRMTNLLNSSLTFQIKKSKTARLLTTEIPYLVGNKSEFKVLVSNKQVENIDDILLILNLTQYIILKN